MILSTSFWTHNRHFISRPPRLAIGCLVIMLASTMMTSSNGNILRVTGLLFGEFTGHRWVPFTKASDAEFWCFFFYLRLNKRLCKQSRRRWFETPLRSLWRHCNDWPCYNRTTRYGIGLLTCLYCEKSLNCWRHRNGKFNWTLPLIRSVIHPHQLIQISSYEPQPCVCLIRIPSCL